MNTYAKDDILPERTLKINRALRIHHFLPSDLFFQHHIHKVT